MEPDEAGRHAARDTEPGLDDQEMTMQNKTKWTAIGAASVLGLGLIGGGAVAAAHATGVNDVSGAKVDTRPVSQMAVTQRA